MWRTIHPLCYLPPIHTLNKSQINDLPHSAIFHVGDKLFKRGQLPCSIRAAALPKMANTANVFYAAYRRPFDFHRVWCIWEFRRGTANRIRHNFPGAPFLPGKTAIQRRNLSLQVLILFQIFKGQVSSPLNACRPRHRSLISPLRPSSRRSSGSSHTCYQHAYGKWNRTHPIRFFYSEYAQETALPM